jgi:ribonuclease HI
MQPMSVKTNAPGHLLGGETQGGETAGNLASGSTHQYTPPPRATQVVFYTDGACEPTNPGGWATWGWVATDGNGTELASGRGCLGHGAGCTNNLAEYTAALEATDWALAHGLRGITLRADSKLVVEQGAGRWECYAEHLVPLRDELRSRLAALEGSIEWIPREANARADALSRLAYAEARRNGGGQ